MRYSKSPWLASLTLFAVACGGGEPAQDSAVTEEPAAAPQEEVAVEEVVVVDVALPEGVTMEMVASGEAIFHGKGICFTCHGQGGVGSQLAPNLTDAEWLNVDGEYGSIAALVKTGVPTPKQYPGMMPARAGVNLADDEVDLVAAYVFTLSHQGD